MKYYSKSFLLLLFLFLQFPQWTVAQSDATLRNRFLSPPEDADSWCFWYWMYGAVSREGITADLEAMKQVGLGGAYLMPIKDTEQGKEFNGRPLDHSARVDAKGGMERHHCFRRAD